MGLRARLPFQREQMVKEVSVELNRDQRAAFDDAKKKLGVTSDQEAAMLALALLDWAVTHAEDGRFVASVSPDKTSFRIREFKLLEALRNNSKLEQMG